MQEKGGKECWYGMCLVWPRRVARLMARRPFAAHPDGSLPASNRWQGSFESLAGSPLQTHPTADLPQCWQAAGCGGQIQPTHHPGKISCLICRDLLVGAHLDRLSPWGPGGGRAVKQHGLDGGEIRVIQAGVGGPEQRDAARQQRFLEAAQLRWAFEHPPRPHALRDAVAASIPADSPMFHSTGCRR